MAPFEWGERYQIFCRIEEAGFLEEEMLELILKLK